MAHMLALKNAALDDGTFADIVIREDIIDEVLPAGTLSTAPGTYADLAGGLLLPGLIDGHLHLDKTLLGMDWFPVTAGGTIRDKVNAEKSLRNKFQVRVEDCASKLLELAIRHGTTSLRTHVDIDDVVGLKNLETVLTLREAWAEKVSIQIVAFPQSGITSCTGVTELLDEALSLGADLIGGLDPIGFDNDMRGHLDTIFGLAEKHGKGIDIHLHDGCPMGLTELREIADRTLASGLSGHVTVSHGFALGSAEFGEFSRTAERLASSGVSILTSVPGNVPCPPIAALLRAGVNVFLGTDNVRDAWSPYTTVGMLDRCLLAAYRSGFRSDEDLSLCFDLATKRGARALGLPLPEIAPGAPADLIVVKARNIPEAIVEHRLPSYVIKRGRVVVRKSKTAHEKDSQSFANEQN